MLTRERRGRTCSSLSCFEGDPVAGRGELDAPPPPTLGSQKAR